MSADLSGMVRPLDFKTNFYGDAQVREMSGHLANMRAAFAGNYPEETE